MKRIIIIGTSGCGKTTLAHQLGNILHLPVYDLDDYHWLPNWQAREADDFYRCVDQLVAQEAWIVSGNYSKVRDLIWRRGDTVIWLNYPFMRVFWQALKRSVRRISKHEPCCNGNYESLKRLVLSDSLLYWIIKTHWRYRKEYNALFHSKNFAIEQYVKFTSSNETVQWLERFKDRGHSCRGENPVF